MRGDGGGHGAWGRHGPTMHAHMNKFKKFKIKFPYDSTIPLLGMYLKITAEKLFLF
jgi:hypothetical protein